MIRMLTPAVAVEAITLRAGEPESVVTATVVRVIAADSGPAASRARVSDGAEPAGVGQQRPQRERARAGRSGATARAVGSGRLAGNGDRSRRSDRPGEPGGRAVPGRGGGVAAAALDAQLERGGALLGDPDDADRGGHAGERLVRDRAALVEDEPRPHAAALAARRRPLARPCRRPPRRSRRTARRPGPACPASSRVSTASQIPTRRALVVEGAAAPDRAVDEVGAERRVLPGRALVDGYDVEVGHQHDRPLGAAPGQRNSRRVVVDPGQLEALVQQRELALELGEERVERRGVDARGVAVGDGRDPHQGLELGDGPVLGPAVRHGARRYVPAGGVRRALAGVADPCLGSETAGGGGR